MVDWKTKKKTTIGGQALIEGVMMRGPEGIAIAVRKPDSEIILEKNPVKSLSKKNKLFGLPLIRGVVAFFESLIIGMNSLTFSAKFFEDEEEESQSKFEKLLEKVFKDKLEKVIMGFSIFLSILFATALFFILPSVLIGIVKKSVNNVILKNLLEGLIRVIIFIIYVALISLMPDIKRVFEYHGAEHKTIFCYENKEELTVENARKYKTLHPRCGTNFLFIVMIVSILVYSFSGWQKTIVRVFYRILLLPLIAGISYEILRFVGRSESKIVHTLIYPGLLLQKLTTREPDDEQLEVAITALKGVLVDDEEADSW